MQEFLPYLTRYGPKSFNQTLTLANLSELGLKKPNVASQIYVNMFDSLPKEDWMEFTSEMTDAPALDSENDFFYWKLAGNNNKTVALMDWEDSLGAKPSVVGANNAYFYLYFGERYFDHNDHISGYNPDVYQYRVADVEQISQNYFRYKVQFVTNDPFNGGGVPSTQLALGTPFSKDWNFQPKERAYSGSQAHINTGWECKVPTGLMRMQYSMAGNMIKENIKDFPIVFPFAAEGKKFGVPDTFWNFLTRYQFEMQVAKALCYSKPNYTQNEQYFHLDEKNQMHIQSIPGFFNQIAPANVTPYTSINLDTIIDQIIELKLAMSYKTLGGQESKYVVLETGMRGMVEIQRWLEARSAQYAPARTLETIMKPGESGGQLNRAIFSEYKSYHGIHLILKPRGLFDDDEFWKKKHSSGLGLDSSRNILIRNWDMDSLMRGKGFKDPNFKRLRIKDMPETIVRYIGGFRSPFDSWANLTAAQSPVDEYSVHLAKYTGGVVVDPTKVLMYKYQPL